MRILKILLLAALPITAFSAPDIKVSDIEYGVNTQENKQHCKVISRKTSSGEIEDAEYCMKNGIYELVDKKNRPDSRKNQPENDEKNQAADSAKSCMTTAETVKQTSAVNQFAMAVGNFIVPSETGLKNWKISKHTFGDEEMTGEQLDAFMTNMQNPVVKKKIAEKLRQKGESEASIEKGQREMQEFIEIKLRQRQRMVTEKSLAILMVGGAQNQSGYLLVGDIALASDRSLDQNMTLCRKFEFSKVTPYQYQGATPSYFYNYGKLFLAIDHYKTNFGYGVLAAGVTADNQNVLVILGNPSATNGVQNGVILKGTRNSNDKAELVGDLTDANYGIKLDLSKIPVND